MTAANDNERAAIVAWLREYGNHTMGTKSCIRCQIADDIERGEHLHDTLADSDGDDGS